MSYNGHHLLSSSLYRYEKIIKQRKKGYLLSWNVNLALTAMH